MGISITHKILFEINIQHHFFLNRGNLHFEGMDDKEQQKIMKKYDVSTFITIEPTPATIKLLKDYKLIFVTTQKGFLVLALIDSTSTNEGFMDMNNENKLSFALRYKDNSMFNYSCLPLNGNKNRLYYFTNHKKDNNSILFPSLSSLTDIFNATLAAEREADGDPNTFAYLPGDLIVDSSTNPTEIFEAMVSTNNLVSHIDWQKDSPANTYDASVNYNEGEIVMFNSGGTESLYKALLDTTGVDPGDNSIWEMIRSLPLHYVNANDRKNIISSFYKYLFSTSGIVASIELRDAVDNLIWEGIHTSTEEELLYPIDLRNRQDGFYHLIITDNSTSNELLNTYFYLINDRFQTVNLFGMIDIYMQSENSLYHLVDGNNVLNQPTFEIRFKNRSTAWKYLDQDNTVLLETNPHPLTMNGNIEVSYDSKDMPNPNAKIIKPETTKYYSEIYINN